MASNMIAMPMNDNLCFITVSKIDTQLLIILDKAAEKLQIDDYLNELDFKPYSQNDGIMSDIYHAIINDANSKKTIKIIIKKAPSEKVYRELRSIEAAYQNEIRFYAIVNFKIYPFVRRSKLEQSMPVASYITAQTDRGNEMVVLKDLRAEGYRMFDELERPLDEDLIRLIFRAYGKFHAHSFCWKHQSLQDFREAVEPFINIWEANVSHDKFVKEYKMLIQECISMLNDPEHVVIKETLERYLEDFKQYFLSTILYQGEYGCILHGDCTLQNMMFRVNSKTHQVDDVKFIGFQQARFGSPVHDLSYFMFIEGSMHIEVLELFLNAYYDSFCTTVWRFNKDPTILLPRHQIYIDWKIYSKSNMLLSMLLLRAKFVSKNEIQRQKEILRAFPETMREETLTDIPFNKGLFYEKIESILFYMYESGTL